MVKNMRLCFNGATTMPYPLETDVEIAAKAGFEGLEIWIGKLEKYLEIKTEGDLIELIGMHGIKIASMCPILDFMFKTEKEFTKILARVERLMKVAQRINCPCIVVCPSQLVKQNREKSIDEAVTALRKFGNLGREYGVSVALEFLSHTNFINNIRKAIELIKRTNHEYVGLAVDSFHWYKAGDTLETLREIPSRKLHIVHINDSEALPRQQLTDENRLLPGKGVIDLKGFINTLKHKGYEGYVSVELFRRELWKENPLKVARMSKKTLETLLKEIKLNDES